MHLSGFNRPTFIIITNLQPLVANKHIHSTSDFPHHDSPTALFSFFSFPPSFSHHYFYLCQINIPFTFSFTTTPHFLIRIYKASCAITRKIDKSCFEIRFSINCISNQDFTSLKSFTLKLYTIISFQFFFKLNVEIVFQHVYFFLLKRTKIVFFIWFQFSHNFF